MPENNTPPSNIGKKSKDHYQYESPVCEREITEAQINSEGEGTQDENEGKDAVFCKGLCQKWFHRTCCGLAREIFVAIESNVPFMCYYCMSSKQRDEINEPKALVAELKNVIKDLTSRIDQLSTPPSN